MPQPYEFRSDCPLASALDVLGDKWTFLVIRDLARNKCTYGELESSVENITTNILADRLKKLVRFGLVEKVIYQDKPKRYHYLLTERGKSLLPLLWELVKWGQKHLQGPVLDK